MGEIQSRLDIVEIVAETVNLSRKGNRYWGRCPFHDEKTASFCVTPEKNMFYCFGCNTGGDMFSFIMKRDSLNFADALEVLAAKAGIEKVKTISTPELERKKRLIALNMTVAEYYHQVLTRHDKVKQYLAKRNINPETINNFKLGYADDAWNSLEEFIVKKGFNLADLNHLGLIKKSEKTNNYFDIFRNRLIFPIHAPNGDVVGFGGRALDDDNMPKYLNSPESNIFSKRRNLYGLFQGREAIRQKNQVILVEGYMDCIKLHQYGINNVVASLGTAFTEEQAKLIKRYAEEVVILYDGDEAGQRETLKAIDVLVQENMIIDVITLPGLIDPDDYLDLYGKEDFLRFLKNNKINYIEFKLNRYINVITPNHIEDKVKIINMLSPDIKQIDSELKKDYLVKLIAQKLKIEENIIYREFTRNRDLRRQEGIKRNNKQIIRDNRPYANFTLEERILAAAIKNPNIFAKLEAFEAGEMYSDTKLNQIANIFKNNRFDEEIELEIRANDLESSWAKIALAMEEAPIKDYELNDFLRIIIRNRKQRKWQDLQGELNVIKQNGNFDIMLNFILNLNTVINETREGGIK